MRKTKTFIAKLKKTGRFATKAGAIAQIGGDELVGDFYRVFSRNMRDLGTPVYPLRFFREILKAFPNATTIVLIRFEEQPVAAGFLIRFRDRVEIPWASSLRESNSLGTNMLMYAKALEHAVEGSFKVFDFGRSSVGSGTHRFKKQWGAVEQQLYWHYWLPEGKTLPQLKPQNPKFLAAIALWKRSLSGSRICWGRRLSRILHDCRRKPSAGVDRNRMLRICVVDDELS